MLSLQTIQLGICCALRRGAPGQTEGDSSARREAGTCLKEIAPRGPIREPRIRFPAFFWRSF